MMQKLLVVAGLSLLTLWSVTGRADGEHDATNAGTGSAPAAHDAAAALTLREDKELPALREMWPNLGDYIKDRYNTALPAALGKATGAQKDESESSLIMADLFNRIDEKQRDRIVELATTKRAEESSKETNRDQRYLDLLDRVVWAGNALQGKLTKAPEAQAFLKKFVGEKLDFKSGDFKAALDKNGETLANIKNAPTNNEAKKWLRENLNRVAFGPYVADELKRGNKESATKLVDAVSWEKNGFKYIDMLGPNKEPLRLVVGKNSNDIAAAIKAWSEAKNNFVGTPLSQTAFATVPEDKTWYVGADGKLAKGSPKGFNTEPVNGAAAQVTQSGGAAAASSSPASAAFSVAAASTFLTANCTSCHDAKANEDRSISVKGTRYTLSEAIGKIRADVGGMAKKVSQASIDQLSAWASGK